MIPNYWRKLGYLSDHQKGMCAICKSKNIQYDIRQLIVYDLHHAGIHNTKVNRKKYPLFIHSLMNLKMVRHSLHMQYPCFGKISYLEADKRERFLERHPLIARFVNEVR